MKTALIAAVFATLALAGTTHETRTTLAAASQPQPETSRQSQVADSTEMNGTHSFIQLAAAAQDQVSRRHGTF